MKVNVKIPRAKAIEKLKTTLAKLSTELVEQSDIQKRRDTLESTWEKKVFTIARRYAAKGEFERSFFRCSDTEVCLTMSLPANLFPPRPDYPLVRGRYQVEMDIKDVERAIALLEMSSSEEVSSSVGELSRLLTL